MGGIVALAGSDRGYLIVSDTREPHVIRTQSFSTGMSSHLGEYSRVGQDLVDLETLVLSDGSFALTLASGETIEGTYAGRGVLDQPGLLEFEASGQVTGGTGRFAGASGRLTFVGVADLATGEFRQTVSGAISPRAAGAIAAAAAFAKPLRRPAMLEATNRQEGSERREL